jgi:hypothetical protein
MQERADTPDERLQRRRIRRWKRRARILGPFLGIPLLLFTLSVSVDLVEYQPQEESDRSTDRPIRIKRQTVTRPLGQPSLSTATQTVLPIPSELDETGEAISVSIDLDLTPPSAGSPKPPTPPYALKRH